MEIHQGITFALSLQSSEHMDVLTQSDMQAINVTLTFLLTHPGYLCVSPTTRGTFFVARLGGTGTLAAKISQTLSV